MLSQNFKLMSDLIKTPGHADLLQGKNQEHAEKIIPLRVFLFLSLLFEDMDILAGLMENLLEPWCHNGYKDVIYDVSNHYTFDTKAYRWGESWLICFNCLNDVLWLLVLCYLCLLRIAFVWPAMCNCGISWSYSLTFVAFDPALHQANRLENLVQLFNAESHAIGIKSVHGIDDAIAKLVFDKCALDNVKLYIKSIGSCFIQFTYIHVVLVGDNFSWVPNCSLESPNTP